MRRSRSPASSYCTASGRDSSDWDVGRSAVIVDVEATTAVRQAEVTAQQRMIDRTRERFGLWPQRLAADAPYGSAENLAWLLACDRHRLKRIPQDPRREVHLVEPLADPPHARGHCRRRHHRSAVWRGTWSPAAPRINGRRLERNRKFVDSPLEGTGFELVWGFPCQVVFFGLLPVLCSEREGPFFIPSS